MKKFLLALLCLAIAASAAACRPNNADTEPPKSERYTDPVEDETEETEKLTEARVKVKHKEVSAVTSPATEPTDEATEQVTEAATQKKKKTSKIKMTEPPTQGATRPGAHITVEVEKGSFDKSDLDFVYDGAIIELGDEIDDAVAILGEEDAVDEFSKTGTEYDFGDITVVSRKRGGKEIVEAITINSEDIATQKNARIGMYATQLRRVYGDPTKSTSSAYVYTIGNRSLIFYHEDNVVNEITYKLTLQ